MTTAIHLCGEGHASLLVDLVARARAEAGNAVPPDDISEVLAPLLSGGKEGAVWLFGPERAPSGYVVLSFRFSLGAGGTIAVVEDIYVRPAIRRRGIATEVLLALGKALRDGGITALTMEVDPEAGEAPPRLAARAGMNGARQVTAYARAL